MGRFWGGFWHVLAISLAIAGGAQAQSLPLVPSPRAGHFEVTLHARRQQASARAEQAAWLSVTVPLDKLALPRVAQQARAAVAPAPAPASAPAAAPAPAAPPPASAQASPKPPNAAAPAAEPALPRLSFQQLRALSEFSRRATVVALGVAGAAAERRRVDALASRAHGSALLPELRLRAVRNTDQALRWVPTTDEPNRVTQADGAGLILEASATFRLDRLLFAHEELTVERLRLKAGEERSRLEARVQAAVLGLFRARQLGCVVEVDDQKPLQLVKVAELFAELDDLTAGWFSDQAANFGRAVWGFPEAVLGACSEPEPASEAAASNSVASLENSE